MEVYKKHDFVDEVRIYRKNVNLQMEVHKKHDFADEARNNIQDLTKENDGLETTVRQ